MKINMKNKIINWLLNDPNGLENLLNNILFISLCITVFIKISVGSWNALIFIVLAFTMSPFVEIPKPTKRLIICLGIVYILLAGII